MQIINGVNSLVIAILGRIFQLIKLAIFKVKWRNLNSHNFTTVGSIFPLEKVKVGKMTYGRLNVISYGNPQEKLVIGDYCSIAGNVKFLLGGEHYYKSLSTYPFNKYVCNQKEDTITKGPIIIGDDVWIGENALILSGVNIGKGAIIGAGSVVAKDIPPYAIYAGGEIKKFRFSPEVVEKLIKFDYSKLDNQKIKDNIDFFYSELDIDTLDTTLSGLLNDSKEKD